MAAPHDIPLPKVYVERWEVAGKPITLDKVTTGDNFSYAYFHRVPVTGPKGVMHPSGFPEAKSVADLFQVAVGAVKKLPDAPFQPITQIDPVTKQPFFFAKFGPGAPVVKVGPPAGWTPAATPDNKPSAANPAASGGQGQTKIPANAPGAGQTGGDLPPEIYSNGENEESPDWTTVAIIGVIALLLVK